MIKATKIILSALVLTTATLSAIKAHADEDILPQTHMAEATDEDNKKPDNSVQPSDIAKQESEQLYKAIEKLMADKTPEQQAHFTALYQSSNIASVIKTVRYDVGQAVESCTSNLPKSSSEMSLTYDEWKTAINGSLQKIESRVNNMIIVQDYVEPQQITSIINQANQLRAKTNASLNKQPITTLSACQHLHQSMSKSKISLTKMADDVLLAIPRIQAKASEAASDQEDE